MQAQERIYSNVLDRTVGDGAFRPQPKMGQLLNGRDLQPLASDRLTSLPIELWNNHIGHNLSFTDLTALRRVSRFFQWIVVTEGPWNYHAFCKQDYPVATAWVLRNLPSWQREESLKLVKLNWRALYRTCHTLKLAFVRDKIIRNPNIFLGGLPNGNLLATGSAMSVVDPVKGTVRKIVQPPKGVLVNFGAFPLFLPGGKTLVAQQNRNVLLYRQSKNSYTLKYVLKGHTSQICCLGGISNKKLISTCCQSIRIWDINHGHQIGVHFSKDLPWWGKYHSPTAITAWNSRRAAIGLDGFTDTIEFGRRHSKQVIIFDLVSGIASHRFQYNPGLNGMIESLVFLTRQELASGHFNGTIHVRNIETGRIINTKKKHRDSVLSLTALPNGILVSGSGTDGGQICVHVELSLREAATRKDDQKGITQIPGSRVSI